MDHVSWSLGLFFRNHLFERPNTKMGDYGTPNAHNHWLLLFYHVWRHACIEIHWNSMWLRTWSPMTSHYTWESVTTLHDVGGVLGWPLDTFLLGSHNCMVTALGSRVKWPLHMPLGMRLGLGYMSSNNAVYNLQFNAPSPCHSEVSLRSTVTIISLPQVG
jgi:hypothetical protein